MNGDSARSLAGASGALLQRTATFQQLSPAAQTALLRDLNTIQQALDQTSDDPYASLLNGQKPVQTVSQNLSDPYVLALATPLDLRQRGLTDTAGPQPEQESEPTDTPNKRPPATETLAARAGALSDEIDFPGFVAGLIHGTFDAIVDASIRQMEAFAELVGAVAKDTERFTAENVTPNQVRDWLVQQYSRDLALDFSAGGQPRVVPRPRPNDDEEPISPLWLADYGLEGQELNEELIEDTLIPLAQRRVGESRLQTLAAMVLMGMNRVVVRDGTIETRVRFRAAARDKAAVDLAISQDPGGAKGWGNRGSSAQGSSSMMVSTVGVNVQSDTELKTELFGAVKINFASETLPLDRFVDAAQLALLQRNARPGTNTTPVLPSTAPATPPPPLPLGS
jgi:hypothetical protein